MNDETSSPHSMHLLHRAILAREIDIAVEVVEIRDAEANDPVSAGGAMLTTERRAMLLRAVACTTRDRHAFDRALVAAATQSAFRAQSKLL